MEARNRKIEEWYGKVQRGEIKLPRFQRFEAWDWRKISGLVDTIIRNLPLGITLVLEVGEEEQFISRYLSTAEPEKEGRVLEQLLDGQQRLTSLWRVLHNNYDDRTYFVYFPKFDNVYEVDKNDAPSIYSRGRYWKKNGLKYPLWCDSPKDCLDRGMVPTNLLRPETIEKDISEWIVSATNKFKPTNPEKLEEFFIWKNGLSEQITSLRNTIKNYNLPFLSLPSNTAKDVALDVFIKMNTNSKPLSIYDIIVAEIESVKGQSLHELQEGLDRKYPNIKYYGKNAWIGNLILSTSSLLQENLPNQRGHWNMDKSIMVDNWEKMEEGLKEMSNFLLQEGILDEQRLPTNAVLSVIAALFPFVSSKLDERGVQLALLKKYMWSAFFTDRYENSAASAAYADYIALKKVITSVKKENGNPYTEKDVPVLNRELFPIAEPEELVTAAWSKRETIRGKAILAITLNLGAKDFATGEKVQRETIKDCHYHHIFPDALLKEVEQESFYALNCALIKDKTNLNIGRKEPLKYLKERYKWTTEENVNDRLNSHLIPIEELANGGYEGLGVEERNEKIINDFRKFMHKRAEYIYNAALVLSEGKDISASEIIEMEKVIDA